jgi:hypothetical protein
MSAVSPEVVIAMGNLGGAMRAVIRSIIGTI